MSSATMFPALFQKSKRKNRSVAEALENDNWIMDVMQDINLALFIDYIMLWTLVDAADLDLSRQEDDSIV
jgi:predicted Co/Zn/Cd cation transporter (cation efflux family)